MRRRRVKADVSRAAVVLTNPTHFAVALGFDFSTMDAPKVLAKGRNLLAEEIKAEARWAGVPIIENPPLARSLYRTVEVGQAIPADLYAAVATILAYLYRQRVETELRERRKRETAYGQASERRVKDCHCERKGDRDSADGESAEWRGQNIGRTAMSTTALPVATFAPAAILHRMREYLLPLAAISVIFVMLIPLPAAALDFLLALSDGRIHHRVSFWRCRFVAPWNFQCFRHCYCC